VGSGGRPGARVPAPGRRYVLTGAPGSGKTTLLAALRERGYATVREAATDVIAGYQACGVAEPWERDGFLADVLAVQVQRQREVRGDPVFCDRAPLCTLALARFLGRPEPPGLAAAAAAGGYARQVLFVRPLGFVTPSAARRISYPDSLAFEAVHEQVYAEFGYTVVDVPAGPVGQRVQVVEELAAGGGWPATSP
jgi:predicted ATPase